MIVLGLPLRAINLTIALRQLSMSNLGTTSQCTTLIGRHLKKKLPSFFVSLSNLHNERAKLVKSNLFSATQPANVIVPESPDMLFSPETVNETSSGKTGKQLTVNSKNVVKTSSQIKATTQPFLFQESATTSTATASLLSKSRKTLLRPVRFSGFKSVRILCLCS